MQNMSFWKMKKQPHSNQGWNFSAVIPTEDVMVPENLTDTNYLLGATIAWHGTITDEDSGGTPKEGCPTITGPQSIIWHDIFWGQLHLSCDILPQALPDKQQSTADMTDLTDRLHDTPQHPNAANNRLKAYNGHLANTMWF
jgi:hypothetical protein